MEGRGRENGFTIYSREGKDKYNMCKNDCTESLCQTKQVLLFCFFFSFFQMYLMKSEKQWEREPKEWEMLLWNHVI